MANIQKRTTSAGVRYRALVRLAGHPTVSRTFHRLTDAKRWVAETEASIRSGGSVATGPARRLTLSDAINRYVIEVIPAKRSGACQLVQLQWWNARLGRLRLSSITPQLLAEQRDVLRTEPGERNLRRSPATVNRYLAAISHCLAVAWKEWGWLEKNPCEGVRRLSEPRGRTRFLSGEECERLLQAAKTDANPAIQPFVLLALCTGARKGELLGLRWSDIDFERRRATLQETKNGERRALPLPEPAMSALRDLARVRRIDTDLVFPGRDPDKPLDIKRPWERIITAAEIRDFRIHDLRHTAASYLAMSGASLVEIAAILGHKTLAMVQRYSHLADDHTLQVAERAALRMSL